MKIPRIQVGLFLATLLFSSLATSQEKLIQVADKIEHAYTFTNTEESHDTVKYQLHHSGASFIKVHFSQFNLGVGDSVTLSSDNSVEKVTYHEGSNEPFFARSISGDAVTIEWRRASESGSLAIDYYTAGYSEDKLQQVGTLSTCGVNERRDAACWEESHPTEFGWSHAVARLLIDGRSLCTAWRVGPENHLMTNNHCVSTSGKLRNTEVWFNYQRMTCNGSLDDVVKVMGNELIKTDYTLDYSLFNVTNFDTIAQFGYLGLTDTPPVYGSGIYIPQHGAGNPKEIAIESDKNGSGLCQIDVASANGRGTGTDTGYFCDTIGGSSGSPVLLSDSHQVVALHHYGGCENQGVKMERIWPEIAPVFGGQLPQGKMGKQPPTSEYPTISVGDVIGDLQQLKNGQLIFVLPASERTQDVVVSMSGGAGDADLYTLSGSRPDKSTYDCRPYRSNSNESCEARMESQDLYILISAYSAFSGVTLSVDVK
ncbi:peptidase [Vibrio campbellii]|uniref:serine protease n=1 Tax=Vibrio sp. LB10LO1 TaxID=2711207 RepID=UPI00138A657E|nr:serine protease [Vibrio sp. LB10LO1]NDJ80063.1 peptidase [Vibrio sp. LB10LO1]